MLQFYSHPLSGNGRRVWIQLLEKQIPFEFIELKLDGDQDSPEFSAINPLQRVPAIADGDVRVVESLAILDYLEAQYPEPSLMPNTPEAIARVRMAEMVSLCDLQPLIMLIMQDAMGVSVEDEKMTYARTRIEKILNFFEQRLLDETPYFLGEFLSLADIVAGTMITSLSYFGFSDDPYPKIQAWLTALGDRPSWQQTAPSPEAIANAGDLVRYQIQRRAGL